jgi:hypothetical protein
MKSESINQQLMKPALFFALMICSYSVLADTEFEEFIPIEVAKMLFEIGPGAEVKIYSDIMDDFPEFNLPDGFSVMGSINELNMLRVVLETKLSGKDATDVIVETFMGNTWEILPSRFNNRIQSGFIMSDPINDTTIQLCHDQFGRLMLNYSERDVGNFIILSNYSLGDNYVTCQQYSTQLSFSLNRRSSQLAFSKYMPRMVIPAGSITPPHLAAGLGSGYSGSNRGIETNFSLEIEMTVAELFDHFAEQIVSQGWELDSENKGSVSANGTWTQNPEPNMNLIGILTVLNTGDDNYQLKFKLIPGGGSGRFGNQLRAIPQQQLMSE